MKKLSVAFVLCALAVCFVLSAESMAIEVSDADVAGDIPAKAEVVVKTPPNPGLVGFFKTRSSEKNKFAYALIEKDGKYGVFARWKSGSDWMSCKIDGDTLYIGSSIKVWITDSGTVYRTWKGKYKVKLNKVN